jgi:hypothetical protein
MIGRLVVYVLASCGQVPPPAAAIDPAGPLREERFTLLTKEGDQLTQAADRPAKAGRADEAASVRALARTPQRGGPIRFIPLPELVPAPGKGLANVPAVGTRPIAPADAHAIRAATAKALFDLAGRAAALSEPCFALADECLRDVLDRDPDNPEARRLLGYVPHQGGWATPHAVQMLREGKVLDPTFGWVDATWVPHLARGELPDVNFVRGQPARWLPADQADEMRRDWSRAWQIKTAPHFDIRTNVPLAEAIAFGRRLESLHDLFFSVFADVIGRDQLPLARRYKNPSTKDEPARKKYQVWYFASKDDYLDQVRPRQGPGVEASLGLYIPPKEARRGDSPRSYFYRDPNGQIEDVATLYHEASHQLLFESAGPTKYDQNVGNFWVWEALGTYFETLVPQADGSLQIGAPIGPRMAHARHLYVDRRQYAPIGSLVALSKNRFNDERDVYLHYAESMALAVFLIDGAEGRYRQGFLDYVWDAYRGKLRPGGTGRSLQDHLGVPYKTLDAEFREFLKSIPKPSE